MRWNISSRLVPALFTTMSSLPKVATASATRWYARSMSTVSATTTCTSPPASRMSAAVSRAGGPSNVVDDHRGAFARQTHRGRSPDAPPSAGHDRNSIFELPPDPAAADRCGRGSYPGIEFTFFLAHPREPVADQGHEKIRPLDTTEPVTPGQVTYGERSSRKLIE